MCFKARVNAHLYKDSADMSDILAQLDNCVNCCNWSIVNESPAQNNDFVTDDYPTRCNHPETAPAGREAGKTVLRAVRLSNECMIKAILHAYNEILEERWTKANIKEYLRTCNIKGSLVEEIYQRAIHDRDSDDNHDKGYNDIVPEIHSMVD